MPIRRRSDSLEMTRGRQCLGTTDDRRTNFSAENRRAELEHQSLWLIAAGTGVNPTRIGQFQAPEDRQRRAGAATKGRNDRHRQLRHGVCKESDAGEAIHHLLKLAPHPGVIQRKPTGFGG